jgi:hypothetical protein
MLVHQAFEGLKEPRPDARGPFGIGNLKLALLRRFAAGVA